MTQPCRFARAFTAPCFPPEAGSLNPPLPARINVEWLYSFLIPRLAGSRTGTLGYSADWTTTHQQHGCEAAATTPERDTAATAPTTILPLLDPPSPPQQQEKFYLSSRDGENESAVET